MSVQRSLMATYLGSGWAAVVGMAVLPFYVRYLGIESYGLIGFFATMQAWLFLLDMGLSPTLNREMARFSAGQHTAQTIRDLLKSLEMVTIIVAIFLCLLIGGLSSWIATDWLRPQALSAETVSHALAVMALAIAFQWLSTLYRSALFGLQHHVWLSITVAGLATLRAVGSAWVLAFISPTISAFVIFQCGVSVVEAVLLAWRVRSCLPLAPAPPKFSLDAIKTVWRFAAGLAIISFLATLLTQVDKLLLAKLLPLDKYGYFSLAVTVAGALSLLIGPIHNVAYPRLVERAAAGDEVALAQEYHHFAQLLSIAVLPVTLVLCVFSKEFVLLWTQDTVMAHAVSPIVSVWVVGTALNGLMHIPYAAQLAHGWAGLSIIVNTIAVLIMIPAMLYWVPKYGVMAAAWIWVGINVGYLLFSISAMHHRILKLEKRRWYFEDVLIPFAAGAFITFVLYIFHLKLNLVSRLSDSIFIFFGIPLVTLFVSASVPVGRDFLALYLKIKN